MAANYKVNIELDTSKLDAQLKDLGVKVDAVGKTRAGTAQKVQSAEEKAAASANKELTLQNSIEATRGRQIKLSKKNVAVGTDLVELGKQVNADNIQQIKHTKLQTDLEIKQANNKLALEKKILKGQDVLNGQRSEAATNIRVELDRRAKQEKALQDSLAGMDKKSAKAAKQRRMDLKHSKSLGDDIVKLKIKEVETEKKISDAQRDRFLRGSTMRGPDGRKVTASNYGPQLPGAAKGMFSGFNKGAALTSATISGAFPLLFGQGPVSALGGAIGGGLGGGLGGQMGGFAGGLAGTTIATGISQLAGSIANLGKAFNSITPDIDALTGALGIAGTEEERRLKLIQKQQGVQAALSAVTHEMNKAIGEEGVENLKRFGETSRLLGNEFTLLMTRMQAALAPLFEALATPFSGPARAREQDRLASIGGADTDSIMTGLRSQLAASQSRGGGGRSGAKSRERSQTSLQKRIEEREKELALLGKGIERSNNLRMIESDLTLKTRQKNELLQARVDGNYEEVKLAQDVNAEVQKRLEAGFAIMEINRKEIEGQIVKTNELTKQAEIVKDIEESYKKMAETIITDMGEGIKGLIKGTSTLNDVLNNVLDKMIDAFLNMAIYGNMSGTFTRGGGGLLGSIFKASGGPVKGGSPYIVGEKGPELFVPNSHGNIVPNNEMGGGANIVVNVDASGSSVEGDADAAQELGGMLAAAIQAELIKEKRPGGLLT